MTRYIYVAEKEIQGGQLTSEQCSGIFEMLPEFLKDNVFMLMSSYRYTEHYFLGRTVKEGDVLILLGDTDVPFCYLDKEMARAVKLDLLHNTNAENSTVKTISNRVAHERMLRRNALKRRHD